MKYLLLTILLSFNLFGSHFNVDSAKPNQELIKELSKVYESKIKGKKVYSISVEGHTDSRATSNYNLKLSLRRAKAALNVLVNMGLKEDLGSYVGYGESRLVNLGNEESDHAQNRRVVVHVDSEDGKSVVVINEKKGCECYRKNAVKLFLGYGAFEIEQNGLNRADLSENIFVGVGYQRMLNRDFSLEAIGTTNRSFSIGLGLHFD